MVTNAIAPTNGRAQRADGLYPGTTREAYERIEAINFSILKHYRRSPAHARQAMLHPERPTEAMEFGSAFHLAVLEPQSFGKEVVAAPKVDRRTAAALVKELLSSPGKNELAVVWTDRPTGLRCKALLDRVTQWAGWTVVIDFKTCEDASPDSFARACGRYSYHEQAAFYLQGLHTLAPINRRWLWVAVEKSEPYGVATYEPDRDSMIEGEIVVRDHLTLHARCLRDNNWPGYIAQVNALRLPRYAFTSGETVHGAV